MERAALLAPGEVIRPEDLGTSLQGAGGAGGAASRAKAGPAQGLPVLQLEELERRAIEEALDRTGWHQGQAAEVLGISDRTLHRKIRGLGLRRPD
jgi:DNA-binding NtrC family response regulator